MAPDFALLHGGGQGGWVWDETIRALAAQGAGRTLALDVPGCGAKRAVETDAIEVADIVEELAGEIAAAGLERPVLVGHSQAGTILPLLAKARPGLFSALVYVTCVAPVGTQTSLSWREAMPPADTILASALPLGGRDRYRTMFCNDMDAATAEAFLDRLGPDRWPAASYRQSGWDYAHLAAIPSTYVVCLRDAALVPAWQEMFAARLHADPVRLDAGHQAMMTRPHGLAEILLAAARG